MAPVATIHEWTNSPSHFKGGTRRTTTIVVGLYIVVAFLVFNVQPSSFSCPMLVDSNWDDYHHGWPLTYMIRDFNVDGADMGGIFHLPWPFFDKPPCRQFVPFFLVFDSVIAALTASIAAPRISARLLAANRSMRSGIFAVIPITLAAWIAIAVYGNILWTKGGSGLLGDSLAWLAVTAAFVAPPIIVTISVCSVVVVLARQALSPHCMPASQIPILLVNVALLVCYFAYVVNDFRQFMVPLRFLTVAGLICVALLICVSAAQRVGVVRAERRLPSAAIFDHPVQQSTIRLITLVVSSTAIYFSLISQTEYFYPDGGVMAFDAYGWPWIYFVDCSETPEFNGYVTKDGRILGEIMCLPLAANIIACAIIIAGSHLTMRHFLSLASIKRVQFRVRTMLWLVLVVSLLLWIPETDRRHVIWPNWFIQLVLYFGIGCGAFAIARSVDVLGLFSARQSKNSTEQISV